MLNSKIEQLQNHFGINVPDDWKDVKPEWIIAQPGVGQQTLNYIRMLLAARNLTLKDDRTPEYWRENLSSAKIVDQLGYGDESDSALVTPFTIYIDSAEQEPFTFLGIRSGAEHQNRTWIAQTEWRSLGRHPDSLGDYSVEGGVGYCHVERKSKEDLQSTLLGFDGRRDRFETELANLSAIPAGCVIVECTFEEAYQDVQAHGKRSVNELQKSLYGSIIAYQQDFKCRWHFRKGRRLAEHTTFRWLERWWRHNVKSKAKKLENLVADL